VTRSVTFRTTVPRIRSSQKISETIEPFSLQRLKRQIHIHIYICRPLLVRGHQAARGFVIVSMLLSISCFKFSSFPCILHSLLVSSFLSKFYSCNASLFLCCYRAHRSRFSASLDPVISAWAPPGYPSKINDFQTYSPDPQNQQK